MDQARDDMTMAEFIAWNRARYRAEGPIVEPGKGYQERSSSSSVVNPGKAASYVSMVRERTLRLIFEREIDIEAGIIHETPAMAEDNSKYPEL